MFTNRTAPHKPRRDTARSGQSLLEFMLVTPVLLLLLLGLIDFGMILFSYASTSNSLRDALRYAEILGYTDNVDEIPYLDCKSMREAATNNYFTDAITVNITYQKADGSTPTGWGTSTYACPAGADAELTAGQRNDVENGLSNGDILAIEVQTTIDPFFLPFGPLALNFDGQRTIVKEFPLTLGDSEGPGGSGPGGPPGGSGTIKVCLQKHLTGDCNDAGNWKSTYYKNETVTLEGINAMTASDGCVTFGNIGTYAYEITVPASVSGGREPYLREFSNSTPCDGSVVKTTFSYNATDGEDVTITVGYEK